MYFLLSCLSEMLDDISEYLYTDIGVYVKAVSSIPQKKIINITKEKL